MMIAMDDNEDKIYKHNPTNFRDEIRKDVEQNMQKFNDPIVLGELMYKLLEERENTNRILKNILVKLDKLEEKTATHETQAIRQQVDEILLPEIDEGIVAFIKEVNKVTAKDVKRKFGYKGTNAASSRLNRLVDAGILTKKQVGKKVFSFLYES